MGFARFRATVAGSALYRWRRPLELYELQCWIRQRSGMDDGLSADQRAHAGRLPELHARCDGPSVLSRRRLDGGERHWQLEQCGHDRVRWWTRQAGRRNLSLSAGTDRFDRVGTWNPFESHSRRYSGLRIRAHAQKSGSSLRCEHQRSAHRRKLEQLEPRPERLGERALATGTIAPSARALSNWFLPV